MKIEISKIKVAGRIRKEVGKIEELAGNIREHGLITPIAVMPLDGGDYQLLAGFRRLRAMELIGETEIDVKVFPASDAESILKIEYSENEHREPFTFSEKMDYAKLIEKIESAKASERRRAGVKAYNADYTPQGADGSFGETRQIVASKVGMGRTTYDRAKYIAANAPPEIIVELDKGERSIRQTYDELRAKEKSETLPLEKNDPVREKSEAQEAASENTPESEAEQAMNFRLRVYNELSKINELINNFEITEYRMEALRDNFDDAPSAEDEKEHIYKSIGKLNKIGSEIYYRKKGRHTDIYQLCGVPNPNHPKSAYDKTVKN